MSLAFNDVRYCLLYLASDKKSSFEPFMMYPVEYTNYSQKMFDSVVQNPRKRVHVTISYDETEYRGTLISFAESEEHLTPIYKWAIQLKKFHVPIERIIYDTPRIVTASRLRLPPLTVYPQCSETETGTEVESGSESSIMESQTASCSGLSRFQLMSPTRSVQPLLPLPTLTSSPVSDSRTLTMPNYSESHSVCEENMAKEIQSDTCIIDDMHSRRLAGLKTSNNTSLDKLIIRRGMQPNTMESMYFLLSLILKKQFYIEEELKSLRDFGAVVGADDIDIDICNDEPIIRDMDDFSKQLSDPEFRRSIKSKLRRLSKAKTMRKSVKAVMKKLFSVSDLAGMNRTGTDGKKKLKGPLENLVKEVVLSVHKNCSEGDIETAIASVLKVASNKERQRKSDQSSSAATQSRQKRKKRSKIEVISSTSENEDIS